VFSCLAALLPYRSVKHGYYWDAESALMLLGVRYYGAYVGRFWSLDPMKDRENWYQYAYNNPVRYIDPCGTTPAIIVECLLSPWCRAVLACIAMAFAMGLGDFIAQLLSGVCCNWCMIGCSALCGCVIGIPFSDVRLLSRILPFLGPFFHICRQCCIKALHC